MFEMRNNTEINRCVPFYYFKDHEMFRIYGQKRQKEELEGENLETVSQIARLSLPPLPLAAF